MSKNKEKWAKKHKKGSVYQAMKKDSSRETRERNEIKDKGMCVTDHAVVRYYERVKQVNMNSLKEEIVPKGIRDQIMFFGKGKFHTNGYQLVVDYKKVITIYREKPK